MNLLVKLLQLLLLHYLLSLVREHDLDFHTQKSDFNINSSIKIKNYLLDKNTKKLKYNDLFIILTEKEIHILEILLKRNEPISKNSLLELVWNYSKNTDTHTVETHIYRLRKKVKDKFDDDNLILNTKTGYSF